MDVTSWFNIETARQKIATLPSVLETVSRGSVPSRPGRDASVLHIKEHPAKRGIATHDGQARLLHDVGNVELQAMELAVRTLAEFPDAPREFRDELIAIAIEESRHFGLCLNALDEMERPWGSFPVHTSLWDSVNDMPEREDLLARIMLVHRYMEGSGLDAGARLLEKLKGVNDAITRRTREVVTVILNDEIGHVSFGSKWYRRVCETYGRDSEAYFRKVYPEILWRMPRTEKPAYALRSQAGFSQGELQLMERALAETNFKAKRPAERPVVS